MIPAKVYLPLPLLWLGFFFISVQYAQVQAAGDTVRYNELNPVVVTGTRYALEKNKSPGTITVVSREAIEENAGTNILPVLSAHVPGMLLNNRSLAGYGVGPNSGGNISIRGISGSPNSRVLVLIDGQPQYMGIFAHPIADAYSSSDIERAEVVRGAASLLYGSNAMGGAINLITRKAERPGWQGSAKLGYGSYNTGIFTGTLGYQKEKLNTFFSINRNRTDGYRKSGKDEFNSTTAFFKLGYDISSFLKISADVQLADATYFHPGTTSLPLTDDKREYLRGRAALSLKNSHENIQGGLYLFHNWGDHEFAEGFQSTDLNQGLTFFQNINLFPHTTVTLGFDHKAFGGKAINERIPPPARVGLGEKHEIKESDVYIHAQQALGSTLSLNAGLRWSNNSVYGQIFLPSAGVNFQTLEHTYLKVLYSTGYRSPAIVDLYLFPVSNPHLVPEEASNYELGITQHLWERKVEVELVGFINKGENLIQVMPVEGSPKSVNSGSFSNKGLEGHVKYHPGGGINFMVNYSRTDVSENILYAPEQMVKLLVNYPVKRFLFTAEVHHVDGLRNTLMPDRPLEAYQLVNLKSNYRLSNHVRLFVEGNNLLDAQYEIEEGYPMPGTHVLGGLHVRF